MEKNVFQLLFIDISKYCVTLMGDIISMREGE